MGGGTFLFVYGTLMRGEHHHDLLDGATWLGEAVTSARYVLRDVGHFPAMFEGGTQSIRGERYLVTPATLARLDRLEGHPRFYRGGRCTSKAASPPRPTSCPAGTRSSP